VTVERPRRLVLVGHPVAHSLSPRFQNAALRAAGIPLVYKALDVPTEQLSATMSLLTEDRAAGNVTIPHKEAAWSLCDVRSDVADRARAVNTFWIEDGRLAGDNTDVGGFDHLVRALLGTIPAHAKIALLGAGGAAAGVLTAVEQWSAPTVSVYTRSLKRAEQLASRFSDVARNETMLEKAVEDATLVINATPIGLHDDDHPIDLAMLPPTAAIIDLVYKPGETHWVRSARGKGFRASDGLPMLVEQGALAFERWFGQAPVRRVMWEAVASLR
jgi:shikimate dehydrogenase